MRPGSKARIAPLAFVLLGVMGLAVLVAPWWLQAGGPLFSGGSFGVDGLPLVWTSLPVSYTTDGGALGQLDNAAANARVAALFQVWEDVSTSDIAFSRSGGVDAGLVPDGNVDTVSEYNALVCTGSPVIYDADGQLFIDLGKGTGVLGFAGPCFVSTNNVNSNSITSGRIALNGRWFDGNTGNGELSSNEFDAVFIHEFGHFFGMDHSQISKECLSGGCADFSDEAFGLPTMFPILLSGLQETSGVHPARTLSADDIAWVSRLYPDTNFNSTFGSIEGTVFFSDGITALQGANVIARQVDDPATTTIDESKRNAVSAVSGFFFRADHGNTALGRAAPDFGSGDVNFAGTFEIPGLAPGMYTVEIETLNAAFTGGSSVGPVGNDRNVQIPLPGPAEFYDSGESSSDNPAAFSTVSVTAGIATTGIDIIVNGTGLRFDSFESETARNDSTATATPLDNGTHAASLSPFTSQGDLDVYSINATSGNTVSVDIRSERDLGAPMDSVVEFVDDAGNQLTTCSANVGGPFNAACVNDDSSDGGTLDSTLHFQPATTGTFYVRVSDRYNDARPDFLYNLVLTGADPIDSGTVFSNTGVITVNDNTAATPYPSNITVSGVTGTVTKVAVKLLGINHTRPDDMDMLLVGPTGANAIIFSDVGGGTDAIDVNLGLDDDAASLLPNGGPLVSGIFQPTNIGTTPLDSFSSPAPASSGNIALSVFVGLDPNGTWSLYLMDDFSGDFGSLSGGWALEIFTSSSKKRRGQITSE